MTTLVSPATATVTTTTPNAYYAIACAPGEVMRVDWKSPGNVTGSRRVHNETLDVGPFIEGTVITFSARVGSPTYVSSVEGVGSAANNNIPKVGFLTKFKGGQCATQTSTANADDADRGFKRLNLLVDELAGMPAFLYRDVITSAVQTGPITLGVGAWAAIDVGETIVSAAANDLALSPITMTQYNLLYQQGLVGQPSVSRKTALPRSISGPCRKVTVFACRLVPRLPSFRT